MTDMRINLPYLVDDRGMIYVRRHGRKIRIREAPGTPEFAAAYASALDRLGSPEGKRGEPAPAPTPRGTAGWLAGLYFASGEFEALAAKSRATRRSIIEACLRESKDGRAFRDTKITAITAQHVKMLRDRASGSGAANNRRKYLSSLFGWAVEAGHMTNNPARDVRRKKYATSGFYTWTVEDVAQFEARWPLGTKPRLALALLLYTGLRRQDVVVLGRQHVKGGHHRIVPQKTSYKRLDPLVLPILPALADAIEAGPAGDMTYLVTEYGQPFTAAGFGGWFRAKCDAADLPKCTAHGLRKAGATILAERGATDRQLMALFGWTSSQQATRYTEAANRQRMAEAAMKLLGE